MQTYHHFTYICWTITIEDTLLGNIHLVSLFSFEMPVLCSFTTEGEAVKDGGRVSPSHPSEQQVVHMQAAKLKCKVTAGTQHPGL